MRKFCRELVNVPVTRDRFPARLARVLVQHSGGGTRKDAAIRLEEKEKEYPEPTMFGTTPAHGLIIRHAAGIEVREFKVVAQSVDARPCILVDDANGIDFSNLKADHKGDTPVFLLNNVKDFSASKCGAIPDTRIAEETHKEL
jgi:hypothetical protein